MTQTQITTTVPVRGRFTGEFDRPLAGQTLLFTPRAKVRKNTKTLVTVVGGSIRVTLDGYGQFVQPLAATDDPDTIPYEWTWKVTEEWLGGQTYDIPVPLAQAVVGLDLTEVSPEPGSGGIGWQIGPTGPAGPPGPAGASADNTTAWLVGEGPPPDIIPGARPGDLYIDNLTGIYYRLI